MGLLDRFAKAVAAQIEKAPNLPAGTVVMTEADMKRNPPSMAMGNSEPLPRDQILPMIPFGPGLPIPPGPINPLRSDGRPDPRRYEYQTAQNINITETRLVPFKTLRAAADQIDILRRCIEVLKSKMVGLEWDITISEAAAEKVSKKFGGNQLRAMSQAREELAPEIARLHDFWEVPDKQNGLVFQDWLNIFLEDLLVIDGVAIWGQKSVAGDLYGFQILDSTTIKPLLDDRGMRPMAPVPAYQQILYGFPRSEFTATSDDIQADGEFTADELAYLVRNRRTFTVYGYSPVERALPIADIYLRRQQWLRSEYTDGVLPELMFTSDANFGNNPELLRAYENIFNDDLSGQTEQRKRGRILPAGITPIQFDGYGEKFKDVLDEYLVTSITGHFGVLPSEIGFTPKTGLGGAGHEQGQAFNAQDIGLYPLANWVGKMLTQLSHTYLGMPRELEFKFMPSDNRDTVEQSKASDIEVRGAKKSINEARAEDGLSLLDIPEADMPMIVAGQSVFFLSPEGIIPAGGSTDSTPTETPAPEVPTGAEQAGKPEVKPAEEVPAEAKKEAKRFITWATKSTRTREFNFETVEPIVAEALNKCLMDGDLETAKALVSAYVS